MAPSRAVVCPQEAAYSRTFMERLDAELGALPTDGFEATRLALIHYGKLRAETRACRGDT